MGDIVERLKQREPWWGKLHDYVIAKRGEAIGTEWFGRFNAIAHSIRGRLPVEDEAADTITTLRATISRLEGEKAKLREALEPFAKCKPPPHHDGKRQVMIEAYDGDGEAWEYGIVDAGDFTRARLALAETGEKP